MRFYVGLERITSGHAPKSLGEALRLVTANFPKPPTIPTFGDLIDTGSRLALPETKYWLFGEGPATHAFVVFEQSDGNSWRLDATAPAAVWSPAKKHHSKEARWLVNVNDAGVFGAFDAAKKATGTPYDWGEVLGQTLSILKPLASIFPVFGKVGMDPFFRAGRICTNLTLDVLNACGSDGQKVTDGIPLDRFPERLAQAFQLAEKYGFLTRQP